MDSDFHANVINRFRPEVESPITPESPNVNRAIQIKVTLAPFSLSVQIRRARESEAAELSGLAVTAKRLWGYPDAQMEEWRPGLQITPAMLASQPTFVAERDHRIVGFYLLIRSFPAWQLDHFWVLLEFNRQGIGRALLEHAKLTAAAGGATAIAIDSDPNAERFYLACGALRLGQVPAPIPDYPDRVRPQLELPLAKI